MDSPADQQREYWDSRYRAEAMIWGERPSRTAETALELFAREGIGHILVPGCGYGRNTRVFSTAGRLVLGVDISSVAIELALWHDPMTIYLMGSVFDIGRELGRFDGIYCLSFLHLFNAADRRRIVRRLHKRLRRGGLIYLAVFSEEDPSFGQGPETEPRTFESKPGRPVHYFTDADLREQFRAFEVVDTGLVEDTENHGGKRHRHVLRYIVARRTRRW